MEKAPLNEFVNNIDFGLITVREDEYRAVLAKFLPKFSTIGRQRYVISCVKAVTGEVFWIAIVRCLEPGTKDGQKVANNLIEDLNPDWLLLVGIGGGIPHNEFTLGDVVLARRLQDFSLEEVNDVGDNTYGNQGGPMHPKVQEFLKFLPALDDKLKDWHKDMSVPSPPVNIRDDNFYGDDDWKRDTRESLKHFLMLDKIIRPPLYTDRVVMSSDRLIKSTELMQNWRKTARYVQTVEMELAGVYSAAMTSSRQYPVLAIRGISDIVGFKRHPDWTTFACESAAHFAFALVLTGEIKNSIGNISDCPARNYADKEDSGCDLEKALRLVSVIDQFFAKQGKIWNDELIRVINVLDEIKDCVGQIKTNNKYQFLRIKKNIDTQLSELKKLLNAHMSIQSTVNLREGKVNIQNILNKLRKEIHGLNQ